jgi:hypothetical protein
MIILAEDYLVLRDASGEGIPCSAEMISVELVGENASMFDAEFIKQAAGAVLHYFRDELGRQTVTMQEFSMALESVLRGFKLAAQKKETEALTETEELSVADSDALVAQSDLCRLAAETDNGGELVFFPRLRDELRAQLRSYPRMLCFRGIRGCVKQLTGARRWSGRCQSLHDQIVDFLRSCMSREDAAADCALVVK